MMLKYIKNNFPNIFIILMALSLASWFEGVSGIFNILFPQKTILRNVIILSFGLLIMMSDDGSLNELYRIDKGTASDTQKTAAGMMIARDY